MNLTWKRVRKRIKGKRNQHLFDKAKIDISNLVDAHNRGEINLYYFDQSGFSLTPNIPYAWQKKGENIELPTQRGGHLNVIGLMNPDSKLKSLIFEGKVDSELIIFCLDQFFKNSRLSKKTVVVIDNSSLHTSDIFQEKIKEWERRNIYFYFLPPYSPELNKIEILWRFIKYYWLSLESYFNKNSLICELSKVLKNVGSKYRIIFD